MQIKPPDIFVLSESEKNSALWQRIVAYLEAENEKDRHRNDDLTLSEDATRNIRAMIAARKSLLKLDQ